MAQKIRKLIIPAAGWGTRFLPFTKAVHKELLPILNKPIIQLLVEEARDAGIEEVIIVLSKRKENIYDYFFPNNELREVLLEKQKEKLLEEVEKTTNIVKVKIVIQNEQLGLGHAILTAQYVVKNEPFAVILGDDLVYAQTPVIRQLIDFYNQVNATVFGVQEIATQHLSKYGVVDPVEANPQTRGFLIKGAVEKPDPSDAPSHKAILGRYVFTPSIFATIRPDQPGKDGEVNLLDNLGALIAKEKVYAYEFEGTRYDLGSVAGFVKANIDYALRDPEIRAEVQEHLDNLHNKLK